MKFNKKDLSIGMEVYVVSLAYDRDIRDYEYQTTTCHITKIGRNRLTVDLVQNSFREFLIDPESCDRFEFAIPSVCYAPSCPTVLCLTESNVKKHILKQKLMKEFSKQTFSESTCRLEQLLLMKAGFAVEEFVEREYSKDAHPVTFASLMTITGGLTKVTAYAYHEDHYNTEILWQGIVDDIPFPDVPFGDWIVEYQTVTEDDDTLKVFLEDPNDKRVNWDDIMITKIKWDTSEDTKVWAKLPDEICVLDTDIELSKYDPNDDLDYNDGFLDDVAEWLTSKYGFCHDGFEIVIK